MEIKFVKSGKINYYGSIYPFQKGEKREISPMMLDAIPEKYYEVCLPQKNTKKQAV